MTRPCRLADRGGMGCQVSSGHRSIQARRKIRHRKEDLGVRDYLVFWESQPVQARYRTHRSREERDDLGYRVS